MHIITGKSRGKTLTVPKGITRPTTQRVKEAIFSSLQTKIDFTNLKVLDLYAGSGALGLEAWSRGAESVLLVDKMAEAVKTIDKNISFLGANTARTLKQEVNLFLKFNQEIFDLIFLDPPYDMPVELLVAALENIHRGNFLAPGGLMILEQSKNKLLDNPILSESFVLQFDRNFGETNIRMYSPLI